MIGLLYASFWDQKENGWHWYKDIKEEEKTPQERIKALKIDLEQKLYKALVNPTQENILNYQKAQKKIIDQSEKFAVMWAKSILNHPELNETIKAPVSFYGAQVAFNMKEQKKQKAIKALSKTWGLFFFFKGDCPYCESFAKIVKIFSDKYNWKVMAISVDGSTLDEFKEAVTDNGIVDALGVEYAPALYMVNPLEKKVVPISHGLNALDTIEDNIMQQMS